MGIMKNFSDSFVKFASSIFLYFEYIDTLKTINIVSYLYENESDMSDNRKSIGLKLSNGKNLFGVKLHGYSNAQMDFNDFEQLKNQYQYDVSSKILHCYVKNNDFQGIYLLTTNERIAIQVAAYYQLDILSGAELVEALLDIYHVNYHFVENKRLVSAYSRAGDEGLIPNDVDVLYTKFRDMISTGSRNFLNNYKFYQGYKIFPLKDRNINKVFRLKWNGVIFFLFDLYQKSPLINANFMMNKAQLNDKYIYNKIKIVRDALAENQLNTVVINVSAILDNPSVLSSLSNELGIDFFENLVTHSKIIPKTPLFTRDGDYDSLMRVEHVADIITCVHKKPVAEYIKDRGYITPDFWGRDINGAFVSYFLGEHTNGHFFIFAKTRAGKSVFLQKMLVQIIGFDIEKEEVTALDDKRIRFFDIGESSKRTSLKLKEIMPKDKKSSVVISTEKGAEFRYSLLEFACDKDGNPNSDEVSFSIAFMSLILEVTKEEPLTAGEQSLVRQAIDRLYLDRNYSYLTIGELKEYGYRDIALDILARKDDNGNPLYDESTYTNELIGEEFDYLKVPPLQDLIDDISKQASRSTTTDNVRADIQSACKKLETIGTIGTYSYYSNNILNECNYFYRDFLQLKEENERLFVQLFWIIFKIFFKRDTSNAIEQRARGEKITPKYYFLEEIHNFFKYPNFKDMLQTAIREAGKAGIRLGFVSQNIEDIPEGVLGNIATKMVLTSPENKAEERAKIEEIMKPSKKSLEVFDQTERYAATIFGDLGTTSCRQEVSELELKFFGTTG